MRRRRRRGRSTLILTALAVVIVLAIPAVAAATTYTVTSIEDGVDKAVGDADCETANANECTLRAAIQESNASVGVRDTIVFSGLFKGLGTSTIVTTGLPAISDPVTVDGDGSGQCGTEAGVEGPCVGLEAGNGNGIEITGADGVTIEGLAITQAATGIAALVFGGNSSEDLTVKNTWIGVRLSGALGFINTGILLGPDADGAVIGGDSPAERNVIANTSAEGLDIQGASEATVRGNWFGVTPEGLGLEEAKNKKDIEITSSFAIGAVGNEIGADVGSAAETSACDGGCNVIANAKGAGIDMRGDAFSNEGSAEGTTIHGNSIGFEPDGSPRVSATHGVDVGGSIDTVVGGPDPGDTNHIGAGQVGVNAEVAPGLVVQGNAIGLNLTETALSADPLVGVHVYSDNTISVEETALVAENRIASGQTGTGIEVQKGGADVIENTIGLGAGGEELGAGEFGIRAYESIGGSLIEGNTIVGASTNGITLQSPGNQVFANLIEDSAQTGILVEGAGVPVIGTEIGGDGEGSENAIFGTGDSPIALIGGAIGGEVTNTVIRRNVGAENGDVFIDLGGNGQGSPGQANGGLQAPTIGTTTSTGAGGTSKPGATIRVFLKATAAVGEIQAFLAETTADGAGNWAVGFQQLPAQTNIAATQTAATGTSELEFAVTPAADPPAPPDGGGGTGGGGGATKDTTAPETRIATQPKPNGGPTVKFKFSSSEAGSSFECKLDGKPFTKCRSPKTYKGLKPGKHVFKVRARDAAGNVDPTPATKKFRVAMPSG